MPVPVSLRPLLMCWYVLVICVPVGSGSSKIGLGVGLGVGLGAAMLVGVVAVVLYKRRKQQEVAPTGSEQPASPQP